MPDAGQPIIHPGVDTSGAPRPRRRRTSAQPPVTSWWATRFLAAIEAVAGPGRLARGLEYARRGRVDELIVEPGHASAMVQGSRPTPYRAALRLAAFDEAAWARIIARLCGSADAAASLAAGAFPDGAGELFPDPGERVAGACTCPDATRPCKHAAALVYTLASRFDKDPSVLFTLRGRPREQLLADLRVARRRAAARVGFAHAEAVPSSGSSLDLGEDLPVDPGRFWSPPAEIDAPPAASDDMAKRLGMPPRALGGVELKMELALAYRVLSERARKLLTP
jgi:uncharacterized Zn finger protein